MKLIDKSALVAEIERRIQDGEKVIKNVPSSAIFGLVQAYKNILSFLDTLELKEVDLEKEYDNEFFKDPVFGKLVNRNAGISIANHFFELGLKARKEE